MSVRADKRFKSQYIQDLSLKHNRLALIHRPPEDSRDEFGYLEGDFHVATKVHKQSGQTQNDPLPLFNTVDEILTLRQNHAETESKRLESVLSGKESERLQMREELDELRKHADHMKELDAEIQHYKDEKLKWDSICQTYRQDIESLEVAMAEHRRLKELSPLNPIAMMAFYGSKVAGTDDTYSMDKVITSMRSYKLESESPLILEFEKRRAAEENLDSLNSKQSEGTHA